MSLSLTPLVCCALCCVVCCVLCVIGFWNAAYDSGYGVKPWSENGSETRRFDERWRPAPRPRTAAASVYPQDMAVIGSWATANGVGSDALWAGLPSRLQNFDLDETGPGTGKVLTTTLFALASHPLAPHL